MKAEPYGQYLLNRHLPEEHKIHGAVSKSEIERRMLQMARDNPTDYPQMVTDLKRAGDRIASMEGMTIGLDDITPEYKSRDKLMAPYMKKFNQATTDDQRRTAAVGMQGALQKSVGTHPGSLTLQVASGARGKAVQYNNLVGGVGYLRAFKGPPVPWIVPRTYSEGLKPADYWASTGQSMMDQVNTNTAVSEPGELAKKLIANVSDQIITEDDCGTQNGLWIETLSSDAIDRFVAKDVGAIKRNTLVTPQNQEKIARMQPKILLRSPATCEASDGICQRCQGLDERGNIHTKGTNVGIRAGQALSEPLTQFALNAKHGGRTVDSDKKQLQGIKGFRQLIETPAMFPDKAALAEVDGKVTGIEEAPQGGYFVTVEKTRHYITPGMSLKVKVGEHVSPGDVLSDGIPRPDDVVRLKGLTEGRLYVVQSMRDLYKTQGKDLDSRHFEVVAKGTLNHARILDDRSPSFLKGDIVLYNTLRSTLRAETTTVPTKSALGETLGISYPKYAAGTRVSPVVLRDLLESGVRSVVISPRAPAVEFVMKSATTAPKMSKDWLARMSHQGLKRSIMQGAAFGERSNLHGTHPVPAYAYGVEFGEGEDGRY